MPCHLRSDSKTERLGLAMFPCCDLSGEKYLIQDEDGSVSVCMDAIQRISDERNVTIDSDEVCRCGCHVFGATVLH